MSYVYWFDEDYFNRQTGTLGSGNLLLDVSSLRDGLHTLNMQLGLGLSAELSSYIFYKFTASEEVSDTTVLRFYYSIDGRQKEPIEVSPQGGVMHLILDVTDIPIGLHVFSSFLMTSDGKSSTLHNAVFYKTPNGGNGITRYEYCLNGDWDNRRTIAVPIQDTLQLITLLPVDTLPIRSACFEFEPNNGSPVIYAKNDISLRFWNAEQRFTETTKQYVDENVMQVVVADTLERDTTKTIPAPCNNSIHWFKLAAGIGDSLAFHTDKPCVMQLYSPSGEVVFSTSGQDAITWHGCHAWEEGDYYLAVHEADCNAGYISVSYKWIYKYALLWHSPHIVGNAPSIVTVNLFGNGYDKLVNVSFIHSDTVWVMDTLLIADINEAFVNFFVNEDLPLGYYNLLLQFSDSVELKDSLIINSAIRIVAAEYGDIDVSYDYISSFMPPHIINLTVSNKGNVPYMAVPFLFAHTHATDVSIIFNDVNLSLDTTEIIDSLYNYAIDLFGQGVVAKYTNSFESISAM